MIRPIVLMLIFAISAGAGAQDSDAHLKFTVDVHAGFLTGEQYLELSEVQRRFYVVGLVDGIFLAPLYGASTARLAPHEKCFERMTGQQIAAILTKHLRDNPQIWHQGAHTSFFVAVVEACRLVQ